MKKQLLLAISMIAMILSLSGMDGNHFALLPAEIKHLTFMWTLTVDSPESLLKSLKTLISDLTILNKDCKQRVTDNDFVYFIRLRLETIGKTIINFVDNTQQTVLHCAAKDPQVTPYLIRLLLRAASVDGNTHLLAILENQDGYTALQLAAHNGHTATVQTLLTAPGVDTHQLAILKNQAEWTALYFAASRGHTPTVQALLTTPGVDARLLVMLQDRHGHTALHFAAFNGHITTVRALLTAPRVDALQLVMLQDQRGYTALRIGTLKSKAIIGLIIARQYMNNSNVQFTLGIAGLCALHYYFN